MLMGPQVVKAVHREDSPACLAQQSFLGGQLQTALKSELRSVGSHVPGLTPSVWQVHFIFIHLIASVSCLFYEELVSLALPSPRANPAHWSLGLISVFPPVHQAEQRAYKALLAGAVQHGLASSLSLHL